MIRIVTYCKMCFSKNHPKSEHSLNRNAISPLLRHAERSGTSGAAHAGLLYLTDEK